METQEWEEEQEEETEQNKWETLEWPHGPCFPPPYRPHGVKFLYDGEPVDLTPEQEEQATHYGVHYSQPARLTPTFNRNFFEDWREHYLRSTPDTYARVTRFDLCDFSLISNYVVRLRQERLQRRRDDAKEKLMERQKRAELQQKHGFAVMDGQTVAIANFSIEPPGLFLGRGQHPKAGCIKRRIVPEDIILNLGVDAPLPPVPEQYEGHSWGGVVHDQSVIWLAKWTDSVSGSCRYTFPSLTDKLHNRLKSAKYDKARRIVKRIDSIRERNLENLRSDDPGLRQCAVAFWLMDQCGIRIGNEKDEDLTGCCSLRAENIQCFPETSTIKIDLSSLAPSKNAFEVPTAIFQGLEEMRAGKAPSDMLFDSSVALIKDYLSHLMPGMTSLLLRVCNASSNLQRELGMRTSSESSVADKIAAFHVACLETAKRCKSLSPFVYIDLYADPRIAVAWCKKNDVPLNSIMSQATRAKHKWALDTDAEFVF